MSGSHWKMNPISKSFSKHSASIIIHNKERFSARLSPATFFCEFYAIKDSACNLISQLPKGHIFVPTVVHLKAVLPNWIPSSSTGLWGHSSEELKELVFHSKTYGTDLEREDFPNESAMVLSDELILIPEETFCFISSSVAFSHCALF